MQGIGTNLIETKRLILRKFEKTDAPLVYKNWTSDEKTAKYLSWDIHTNEQMTEQYVNYIINNYHDLFYFDFVVILKETMEPIGEISAVRVFKRDDMVEMGDCYGSPFWNKGYGTEALKAFIQYMLEEVKVSKVIAKHISTNPASGRIMIKAGMKYEATLKGFAIDKSTGKREDLVYYSIDKE